MAITVDIKAGKGALLIGVETVEGTPETLVAASALYAEDVSFTKQETLVQRDQRTSARPLDVMQQAVSQWWQVAIGKVPYSYSGSAGVPSALEPLFNATGADSTVVAATSVTYSRSALSDFDSATVEFRTPLADGSLDYRRLASAVRGQLGFRIASGEDIVFNLSSGVGNYYEPDSTALVSPDLTTQRTNLLGGPRPELIQLKTLDGHDLCLSSVEATNFFGYDIAWYEDMCTAGGDPQDSTPPGSLTLTYAMPDWDNDHNPYNLADRSTMNTVPFALVVGSTPGQILEIRADEVQVGEPVEVALGNGKLGMQVTLAIVHNPTIVEK